MVVGIYHVPDAVSPKRRCSEGSSSILPCGRTAKRQKNGFEETAVILEAPEGPERSSSVVLLEENGGIWHVDGLLELLAGALCATFGADPASLDLTCASEAPSSISTSRGDIDADNDAERSKKSSLQLLAQQHIGACHAAQQLPPRPTPTALTELNLLVHTASASASAHQSSADDEDRSSVASLSAWVAGTQSPRRRGSEAGTHQQQQQQQQLLQAAMSAFSFTPRSSSSGSGSTLTEGLELPRWPRRRVSAACGVSRC